MRNGDDNTSDMDFEPLTKRKESTCSIFSNLHPLHNQPQSSQEEHFWKDVYPTLDGFATLNTENDFPPELESIDTNLFGGNTYNNQPEHFFNLIEKEPIDQNSFRNRKIQESQEAQEAVKRYYLKSIDAFLSKKKIGEAFTSAQFSKRLENLIFVELQAGDKVKGPFHRMKSDYVDMLYQLKKALVGQSKMTKLFEILIDFSMSTLNTMLRFARTYDEKKMSNCLMQMASMEKKMENFKFPSDAQMSEEFSNAQSNSLSFGSGGSGSNSIRSRKKKRWSGEEEKELIQSIISGYPDKVSKEQINQFSMKWQRTITSIKSKIQKIRKRYQNTMENELDQFMSQTSTTITNSSQQEQETIIIDTLKKKAKNGLSRNKLRSYIPVQIVDNHLFDQVLEVLQRQGNIVKKVEYTVNLKKVQVDSSSLRNYFESFSNTQRSPPIFSLEELFPFSSHRELKASFISSNIGEIVERDHIYWIG